MSVPDAWDECGGCGHDRDDHDTDGCQMAGETYPLRRCPCDGFQDVT